MKKGIYLAVDNTMKVELTSRDFAALNLCRNVLEGYLARDKESFTVTPDGELITLNSAVEVLEVILERCRKDLK